MPQPFNNAVLTDAGIRLLTRAQAGEVRMQFTRIAVGSGVYDEDEKTLSVLQKRTGLKAEENSYPISDIEIYSEYSVKATALITNQDPVTGDVLVRAGYYINEMGLYAKEQDDEEGGTEVLYSIAVTAGNTGDFMPPYNGYNPAQIIQDYYATVSNASEVTICTKNQAVALAEDLEEVRRLLEGMKGLDLSGGTLDFDDYGTGDAGKDAPDVRTAVAEILPGITLSRFLALTKAALMGLATLDEVRMLLVNNGECTEPGNFFLDAAFGKTLQDQITRLDAEVRTGAGASSMTVFNDDGSITTTYADGNTIITEFGDGTVTRTCYADGQAVQVETTTFNDDGSIKKEVQDYELGGSNQNQQ